MSDSEADNLVTFGHIKAAWTFLHTWHIANVKRGEMIRQRVPLVQLVKSSLQQHLVAALNLWCKINQIALKKKKKKTITLELKPWFRFYKIQLLLPVGLKIKGWPIEKHVFLLWTLWGDLKKKNYCHISEPASPFTPSDRLHMKRTK